MSPYGYLLVFIGPNRSLYVRINCHASLWVLWVFIGL